MSNYNNFRRLLRPFAMVGFAAVISFAGCTEVDDTLGSNLIPNNQQMKAGFVSLGAQVFSGDKMGELNPKKYVETRLFQTDSIVSSDITYGYMGSSLDAVFGLRTAGFLSQYTSYYQVDSGYFGYRPIFDSVQLMLSINSYGSDTITPQRYNVYEVTDNKYLDDTKAKQDTVFYLNFDPQAEGIVGSEPLFTFTFPDGTATGPTTTAVTMNPTDAGREFVRRLMLQSGKYAGDYSVYSADSLEQFVAEFKGLYIVPAADQTTVGKGTIYETDLASSGFTVYGRNRVKSDPTLIQDTIGMTYMFYDSYAGQNGGVSVNHIRHDYAQATAADRVNIDDARETNPDRPLCNQVYVEGEGGVVTEITFTQAFFDELDSLITAANTADVKNFTTLAFNQVRMSIYFPGSNYDWMQIDPAASGDLIAAMNDSQDRLGLYTDYKMLTGIPDYAYAYEQTYMDSSSGSGLAYDGHINRSRACYTMDITSYIQILWSDYVKLKAQTPAGQAVDLMKVPNRSIYLGPEAYSLYTQKNSILQGMTPDDVTTADAPIRFDISYNLIK